MSLRELVTIHTGTGMLVNGELSVGLDGLPQVTLTSLVEDADCLLHEPPHTIATFPAAWSLSSSTCGPLYTAWRDIEEIMEQLKEAEREAENEAKHGRDG